ncbi:hypothetical protein HanRHA438_Chr12g0565591 [Helianthus annuus]|nr:hypothetical protein HanRHA438_Chr12g0565591 [Helianthus annuus]
MTASIGLNQRHYAMVDLLASGRVHDVITLCSMKVAPSASSLLLVVFIATLSYDAAELFKIDPHNSGNYVLLSNIYAALGEWRNVAKVRATMRRNQVRKNRGSSWIELDSMVCEFVMGDLTYLNSENINYIMDLLAEEMKLEE